MATIVYLKGALCIVTFQILAIASKVSIKFYDLFYIKTGLGKVKRAKANV